ncbi:unnamed protein product [Durusdinium trenchii]|uniref:Nucleotide-diphospho-sugar transferase domain-containing protein n=1 Tax=Durusdinium trenchii TaxID=1381693 RepID=A0ABP0NLD2_9DINO
MQWCGPGGPREQLLWDASTGLALPTRTLFVTLLLHPRELPLFSSWKCHAERLNVTFLAASSHRGAHRAMCQESSFEAGFVPGPLGSSPNRLWLLSRLLEELSPWNFFYLSLDAVFLHPFSGWHFQEDLVAIAGTSAEMPDEREHFSTFFASAIWLRSLQAVAALLHQVSDEPQLLGSGSFLEESLALQRTLSSTQAAGLGGFTVAWVQASDTLISYGREFSIPKQVQAMRHHGHWFRADGEYAALAGDWELFYSNGFRTVYHIMDTGEVTASSSDGQGEGMLEAESMPHEIRRRLRRGGRGPVRRPLQCLG